jgi:hypothetical protein
MVFDSNLVGRCQEEGAIIGSGAREYSTLCYLWYLQTLWEDGSKTGEGSAS